MPGVLASRYGTGAPRRGQEINSVAEEAMNEDQVWKWARVVAVLLALAALCAWLKPELFGIGG